MLTSMEYGLPLNLEREYAANMDPPLFGTADWFRLGRLEYKGFFFFHNCDFHLLPYVPSFMASTQKHLQRGL